MHVADLTLTVLDVGVVTLVHNDRLTGGYVSYKEDCLEFGAWKMLEAVSVAFHTY